jgi:hypothetical protein
MCCVLIIILLVLICFKSDQKYHKFLQIKYGLSIIIPFGLRMVLLPYENDIAVPLLIDIVVSIRIS